MSHSVQIVVEHHDIKVNPAVREKYPILCAEVDRHDLDSFSSWYELTDEAYDQWLKYIDDDTIPFIRSSRR